MIIENVRGLLAPGGGGGGRGGGEGRAVNLGPHGDGAGGGGEGGRRAGPSISDLTPQKPSFCILDLSAPPPSPPLACYVFLTGEHVMTGFRV